MAILHFFSTYFSVLAGPLFFTENPDPSQSRSIDGIKILSPGHTVDGRNPAPPWMEMKPANNGMNYLSSGAGFLPSTVVLYIDRDIPGFLHILRTYQHILRLKPQKR